jgi:hypothetical protein
MCTTDFRALMDVFTEACEKAGDAATDTSASSEKADAKLTGQKRPRSPEPSTRDEKYGGTVEFKRGRYS